MGCNSSNIQQFDESNISNELSQVDLTHFYDFTNDESHFKGLSGNYLVSSIYDGDTITILMPLSLEVYQFENIDVNNNQSNFNNYDYKINKTPVKKRQVKIYKIKIRVYGIDAYEIKPRKNIPDRENHINKAKEGKKILEDLILNKIVNVKFSNDTDKYGRTIANIFYQDKNIAEYLFEKKLVVSYYGGTKTLL